MKDSISLDIKPVERSEVTPIVAIRSSVRGSMNKQTQSSKRSSNTKPFNYNNPKSSNSNKSHGKKKSVEVDLQAGSFILSDAEEELTDHQSMGQNDTDKAQGVFDLAEPMEYFAEESAFNSGADRSFHRILMDEVGSTGWDEERNKDINNDAEESIFYYELPLDINDVPSTTEEFHLYAKLSEYSELRLRKTIEVNPHLQGFKFRSPHEAKMALVSIEYPLGSTQQSFPRSGRLDADMRKIPSSSSSSSSSCSSSSLSVGVSKRKDATPTFSGRGNHSKKSPTSIVYYFGDKLSEEPPVHRGEARQYNELSKSSTVVVTRQLSDCKIDGFKFRSKHEMIMAILIERAKQTQAKREKFRKTPRKSETFTQRTSSIISVPSTSSTITSVPSQSSSSSSGKSFIRSRLRQLSLDPEGNSERLKEARSSVTAGVKAYKLPDFKGRLESTWLSLPFFFSSPLSEDKPTNVKQAVLYGKLARMSSVALDTETSNFGVSQFSFRSDHEKVNISLHLELPSSFLPFSISVFRLFLSSHHIPFLLSLYR